MMLQARQIQPLPIRPAILGPALILCLFMLAGLVWAMVGARVMQGAQHPAPRTSSLL